VLENDLPLLVRYCIAASIILVCAVPRIGLQSVTGYPGCFLLLPGGFLSGLMFGRGSGILAAAVGIGVGAYGCACRKSIADILVVQPAENRAANNLPGSFDGTRERRILPQGEMCPGAIVICYV
jgi:hypothetical protein